MSVKQTRPPVGHPGGPFVVRGRSNLNEVKCPVGGCEGYGVPMASSTAPAAGKKRYRCSKCHSEISTTPF